MDEVDRLRAENASLKRSLAALCGEAPISIPVTCTCDVCKKVIGQGQLRFKCIMCPNYDECFSCATKCVAHAAGHVLFPTVLVSERFPIPHEVFEAVKRHIEPPPAPVVAKAVA